MRATREAYELMQDGAIALAQVEANGLRVDTDYLSKTMTTIEREIAAGEDELRQDDVFRVWRRRFGSKTNLTSRDQLGVVLFKELGLKCENLTKTGKPATDDESMEDIDLPFVEKYMRIEKKRTANGTFLKGIARELCGEILHPNQNLHLAQTYRGSSDNPNAQNWPVRDWEIGPLIRRCFIPRPNCRLVDSDFRGIEVMVGCCYHKDPVMETYIRDKTKDMHRDMAMQCYMVREKDKDYWKVPPGKNVRYSAKNMFVFPQFYGDYYGKCAKSLWKAIKQLKLATKAGTGLYEHLAGKGINERGTCDGDNKPAPGTFEAHIQAVEKDFWNVRFKVYTEWKKRWHEAYLKNGFMMSKTGFYIGDKPYRRNQIINFHIQGDAFHCLLWCLIRLQKRMNKLKMKSKIIGQIHDAIIADVHKREYDDYIQMVQQVVQDLMATWRWLIVPLEIEIEAAGVGEPWSLKKAVEL